MAEEDSQKKSKGFGCLGCLGMLLLLAAVFGAGVLFSAEIQRMLGNYVLKPEDIAEGSPQNPYDISVTVARDKDGKIQVFLKDLKTNKVSRVDENLGAKPQDEAKGKTEGLLGLAGRFAKQFTNRSIAEFKHLRDEMGEKKQDEEPAEKDKKPDSGQKQAEPAAKKAEPPSGKPEVSEKTDASEKTPADKKK